MRVLAALVLLAASSSATEPQELPWTRHVIDDSSRGADGVKLGDVNADGQPDIVTPWEEGGVIRVYIDPGSDQVRNRWPAVTVGRVGHPEDAVFADLDRDGSLEVVSCCEGSTRAIFIHRLTDPERLHDETAWETERIAAADGRQWMQCLPIALPLGRTALVIGSKGKDAILGVLLPARMEPLSASPWQLIPIAEASWIMSIEPTSDDSPQVGDIVFDQHQTAIPRPTQTETHILVSDRRGAQRGVSHWSLSHDPLTPDETLAKKKRNLGGKQHEVMFVAAGPLNHVSLAGGTPDVVVATSGGPILRLHGSGRSTQIPMPPGTGTGKAVAIADLNGDGRRDIAVSCENAKGKIGVFWLEQSSQIDLMDDAGRWQFHDISGLEGTKFDRIELLDLDGDGDLDLLTCEEAEGLGVVWYENPLK